MSLLTIIHMQDDGCLRMKEGQGSEKVHYGVLAAHWYSCKGFDQPRESASGPLYLFPVT